MRRHAWVGIGLILLLALDWAALHDILKRNEPDYSAEYTVLGASVLIFAGLILPRLRRLHQKR